jgi:RNA polymerase sigma-70 factor (ECF subfamily)
MMSLSMRYLHNRDDAEDALNSIYMKIITNLPHFNFEKPFIPWVKRIAINHLIDKIRNRKIVSKFSGDLDDKISETVQSASYATASQTNTRDLRRMISELPLVTGQVFNLFIIDGYSHKEIGALLNISEGTSKWHLNSARTKLKHKLFKEELRVEEYYQLTGT